MEVRWGTTHQEGKPPAPPTHTVDTQVQDEPDPRLALEMAIEWAHLGGD